MWERVSRRARKAVGAKKLEQDAITFILIQEVKDREERRHVEKNKEAGEKGKPLVDDAMRWRNASTPLHPIGGLSEISLRELFVLCF